VFYSDKMWPGSNLRLSDRPAQWSRVWPDKFSPSCTTVSAHRRPTLRNTCARVFRVS